jgi:hypothetical protein
MVGGVAGECLMVTNKQRQRQRETEKERERKGGREGEKVKEGGREREDPGSHIPFKDHPQCPHFLLLGAAP